MKKLIVLLFIVATHQLSAAIIVQAYYRMGEDGAGTNNRALDSSANGYDLESNVGGTPVIASVDPAPGSTTYTDFNGIQGFYGTSYDARPTDNFGIEGWFRVNDLAATSSSVMNFAGLNLGWRGSATGFQGALTDVAWVGSPYAPTSADEWVNLAVVRDASTTTLYVNGSVSGASSAGAVSADYETHMAIAPGGGTKFNGDLDELRIFTFNAGEFSPDDLLVNSVPEPGSFGLLAFGMLMVWFRRRSA